MLEFIGAAGWRATSCPDADIGGWFVVHGFECLGEGVDRAVLGEDDLGVLVSKVEGAQHLVVGRGVGGRVDEDDPVDVLE